MLSHVGPKASTNYNPMTLTIPSSTITNTTTRRAKLTKNSKITFSKQNLLIIDSKKYSGNLDDKKSLQNVDRTNTAQE